MMQTLQDTFWRTRLDAMAAYKELFCEDCRKDNPDITAEESANLYSEYQRAWNAYRDADVALFEYEASLP